MDSGSQFPERQEGTQPHQQGDPRSANLLQQRRRENTRFTGGYQPSGTQGDSTPITDTDYSLHLQQEQTGGPSHQQQMQREIPDKLIGPEPHALSSHSNAPSSPFGSSSLSDNTENWRRNPAGSSRSPGSYDTLQMPDTPTQRSDSSLSHHVYRQAPFAGSNPAGPSSPGLEQSLSQTRTQEIPTMHTDSPTERIPWQNHELETLIDTVHKLRKNNRNAKPDGELIKKLRENRLDSREANVVREILKRERINYTSATGKYILDYSKPTTKEKRLKTAQKRNILGPDGKPNVRALIKAQNADLAQKRNILGPDGKPDVRALRKAQNADLAQRRNILGPDGKPNVPALKKAQDANTLKKAQDEGYKNLYDKKNKKAQDEGHKNLQDKLNKKAQAENHKSLQDKLNKKAQDEGYKNLYDKKNKKAQDEGYKNLQDKLNKQAQAENLQIDDKEVKEFTGLLETQASLNTTLESYTFPQTSSPPHQQEHPLLTQHLEAQIDGLEKQIQDHKLFETYIRQDMFDDED